MKSWKTTLAGALAALGAYFSSQEGALKILGTVLMALGSLLTGIFARDNTVTSEKAGAK